MKLITTRDAIKRAITSFRASYGDGTYGNDRRGRRAGAELAALDPDTVDRAVVDEIIGNDSWTGLKCNECGDPDNDAVVQVGEEPDYESATAYLCLTCVEKC